MALGLGGCTFLKSATMLEQLLEEINFQRTKEMRQLMKDECGFVVLQGTTYWTDLFVRHFLFQEEQAIDCDDLLFFVRKRHVKGSSRYLPKYETDVEVFRKDSKKLPIGDPEIDWEETVYLNLIVHQFDYTLTLAICTRTSPKELQVLKRHSQKVYASPSRRKMDTKGEGEEMTYPHICFMVDNFDEVFCDIVVRDGEMVCVELVAKGRGCNAQAVIFLGSIRYDTLTRVYDSRQTSLSTKVAQRMSFGLLGGKTAARCEFVRMKGPGGKGHAEMAVSRPRAAGADTPASEPGLAATDMWDSDWDDDPEEMFVYRHQRRLSDPSANINTFSRGGWRTKDSRDKSRSENEGLDSLLNGVAEVEAGDLRDERRRWQASSARRRSPFRCDVSTPACLHTLPLWRAPRPAHPALPAPLVPLVPVRSVTRPLRNNHERLNANRPARPARRHAERECEIAGDAVSLDERDIVFGNCNGTVRDAGARPAVRGAEELPCRLPALDDANGNDGDDEGDGGGAEGAGGAGQGALCNARHATRWRGGRAPPRRTTADGTDIYYWCDVPHAPELDDGAYNPLWAMRGFTQTFHLWKEGKRQQSTPLNAYLTYVTLPWWTIAKDILDHREEPILTF